jgi:hypothetical protein
MIPEKQDSPALRRFRVATRQAKQPLDACFFALRRACINLRE